MPADVLYVFSIRAFFKARLSSVSSRPAVAVLMLRHSSIMHSASVFFLPGTTSYLLKLASPLVSERALCDARRIVSGLAVCVGMKRRLDRFLLRSSLRCPSRFMRSFIWGERRPLGVAAKPFRKPLVSWMK